MTVHVPHGYTQADFLRDVLAEVPEAEATVREFLDSDDGEGQVHAVMMGLGVFVQRAARRRSDLSALRRALQLVSAASERKDADPEIPNAAHLSFLDTPDIDLLRDAGVWRYASDRLKGFLRGVWE